MNVALVCIAKDEDNYIDEWIEYHIKLGFSKIIIYQNRWRYTGKYKNKDFIQLIEFDGFSKQLPAYNDFIQNNYNKYDWAAFIDIDEFIVLKQKSDISSFLIDYNDYNSVALNWSVFGAAGLKFNGDYSVIKRFTKCKKKLIHEVKCFINFNKSKNTLSFNGIGYAHNIGQFNKTIAVNKLYFINGPFNENDLDNRDIAYINHYNTKTKEEWDQKIARGDVTAHDGIFRNGDYWFNLRNTPEYEEYEDLTAYNFMYDDKKGNNK